MSGRHEALLVASAAGGAALAAVFGAVALVRRDRPLHAYGHSHTARLAVDESAGAGVPLLDQVATHDVAVRISRAASFAHHGPDVIGLALRLPEAGGHADLLFASTFTGPVSRHVLRLHTGPRTAELTTLLPLESAVGTLYLRLSPRSEDAWGLSWSRGGERDWQPAGTLELTGGSPDPGHFDPTGHLPRGVRAPGWVRAVRGPSYTVARWLVPGRATT